MTETLATLCVSLFMWGCLSYIHRPLLYKLIFIAAASFSVVAMRVSLLPLVIIMMLSIPVIAAYSRKFTVSETVHHIAAMIICAFIAQYSYMQIFSKITAMKPGYNANSGFFLAAAWAPLIKQQDFPSTSIADDVMSNIKYNLSDREKRGKQLFLDGGLRDQLLIADGRDERKAEGSALSIAHSIMKRDTVGIINLGFQTYLDFFNPVILSNVLKIDEGELEFSQPTINYFSNTYHEDISGRAQLVTYSKKWHSFCSIWYLFLLLLPVVSKLSFLFAGDKRGEMLAINIAIISELVIVCIPVTEPVVRYLHPLGWFAFIVIFFLISRLIPTAMRNDSKGFLREV